MFILQQGCIEVLFSKGNVLPAPWTCTALFANDLIQGEGIECRCGGGKLRACYMKAVKIVGRRGKRTSLTHQDHPGNVLQKSFYVFPALTKSVDFYELQY